MPLTVAKQEDKQNQQSPEDGFREALQDVTAIASKLSHLCNGTISEMVEVISLALENDSQLRFLMALVQTKTK